MRGVLGRLPSVDASFWISIVYLFGEVRFVLEREL